VTFKALFQNFPGEFEIKMTKTFGSRIYHNRKGMILHTHEVKKY